MLEVFSIAVNYGVCDVVRNVSFSLADGEVVVLLGANGAGKTTLLRSLNGALPISKGEILLNGNSLAGLSRKDVAKQIAVVAQENETKFPVRVLDFVLGGRFAHGSAFGFENASDYRAANAALKSCDLEGFEDRLMNKLSGGERQRAIFARALAAEARILLLDEPSANLDLAHQIMLFGLVRSLCRQSGHSAVVIIHDLNLASEFADKILLMRRGGIIAAGPPKSVLTAENIREAFGVEVLLEDGPQGKKNRIVVNYGF